MRAVKVVDDIYRLSVNIEEEGYLFEGIWPIPDGASINCYVIKGPKNVVIDLMCETDEFEKMFHKQLDEIGLTPKDLDYLIVNHMEPDHSGYMSTLRKINPDIKILCTDKAKPVIKAFTGIDDAQVVKDGESLDIGNGKKLTFYYIPNVHWPETMGTFEESNKILFPCDAFGSYGSVRDEVFDDELSHEQDLFYQKEMQRYYANIVASFSPFVKKAIAKLGGLEIKQICPSHGIMWRSNLGEVIGRYLKYAGYADGETEKEITVLWSTMYGNTKMVLNSVVQGIRSEGVPVHIHEVPRSHLGFVMADVFKSTGLVIGTPTYEYGLFPPMAAALDLIKRKKMKKKKMFRFGSFGWSGGAQKELDAVAEALKWDCIETVEWQGAPTEAELQRGYERGKKLAQMVKEG